MCRSYFHVTCAQREGLLSEAAAEEVLEWIGHFVWLCTLLHHMHSAFCAWLLAGQSGRCKTWVVTVWQLRADCIFLFSQDIADPFFAYCKQHADRFDRKWKRKNYLALQSNCKVSLLEREKQLTPEAQVGLSLSYQLQQPSVTTVEYFHIQLNGYLLTAIELYN